MGNLRAVDKYLRWSAQSGKYEPVNWRRNVFPSWLYFDLSDVNGVYTVAAAGTSSRLVAFRQPYFSNGGLDDGLGTPFETRALVFEDSTDGTASANFTVELKEIGQLRDFQNRPIHVRAMFGTAQLPAMLREPIFIPSQHQIQMKASKISGGATTMRMFLVGPQYYPWAPQFLAEPEAKANLLDVLRKWKQRLQYVYPYWQTTDTDVLVLGNATTTNFMKIGDDGHFEAFTLVAISTGNFALEISEVKSGQTLMNGMITQTNGIGNAQLPTILVMPYLVPAGTILRCTITDLSGIPNQIFLTLVGRKICAPFKDVQDVLKDTELPVQTPADAPTLLVPKPL